MPDYQMRLLRKIPYTNTAWTHVATVEFTAEDDDTAVNLVTTMTPESISKWRT
jgi:hypothetical protein